MACWGTTWPTRPRASDLRSRAGDRSARRLRRTSPSATPILRPLPAEAVAASCAVPAVFEPVEIRRDRLRRRWRALGQQPRRRRVGALRPRHRQLADDAPRGFRRRAWPGRPCGTSLGGSRARSGPTAACAGAAGRGHPADSPPISTRWAPTCWIPPVRPAVAFQAHASACAQLSRKPNPIARWGHAPTGGSMSDCGRAAARFAVPPNGAGARLEPYC